MDSAQEILFAAIFALLLVALAVYFVYLIRLAWRRVASVLFRTAALTGCTFAWSLAVAGFVEYCGSWARSFRHPQVAYDLWQISGIFLFVALATFAVSFVSVVLGIAESALRGHKPSNPYEESQGSSEGGD
jgi:hypothetical protein